MNENTDCKCKTCPKDGQVKCMECREINSCPKPQDQEAAEWRYFRTYKGVSA